VGRSDVLAAALHGHLPQSPVAKGPRRLLERRTLTTRAVHAQPRGLDPAAESGHPEVVRELQDRSLIGFRFIPSKAVIHVPNRHFEAFFSSDF
jgi:hypothetical protein